jgi:hypothetical protein
MDQNNDFFKKSSHANLAKMAFLTQNTQTQKVNPKKIAIFHQKFVKIGKIGKNFEPSKLPRYAHTYEIRNDIPVFKYIQVHRYMCF